MNTFSENPMFLFVDDLVDDSPNFASKGKIVELFDTGCDARRPGAAFKIAKVPDTAVECSDATQNNVPNVRKPFSLSLRQDKTLLINNTSLNGNDDKKQNIIGKCKSPSQGKPVTLNSSKDNLESKPRPKASPEKQKARPNANRTWLSSKYSENNRTKLYKRPEVKTTICRTFEERRKANLTKSATNSETNSNVISEVSLNHGVKKVVNRAVDKDSLSNCSRQLEMARTSGASVLSKTSYASRLPRSAVGTAKTLAKTKTNSETSELKGTAKVTKSHESNTTLSKIIGDTDQEVRRKSLQSLTAMRTTTIARLGKTIDRPGGETTSKVDLDRNSRQVSRWNPRNSVEAKTTTTSRSKITASKVPLPRFGRNSIASEKHVQRIANVDEAIKADQKDAARKSKSNDKLSSEIEKTDTTRSRELENKVSAIGRPATYPEKMPARPSTKHHDLIIPRETEAKKSTISFQETKLPKPRTPSIRSKIMNEFRPQERSHNKMSARSPGSLMSPAIRKSKTESIGKPSSASGIPSDQHNDKSSRFQMKEVSCSKIPFDHQSKSKAHAKSVSLTGIRAVEEKDEEIELKNIFDDTSATVNRKSVPKSHASPVGTNNDSKDLKLQDSPVCSSTGSKVPRPVVVKRFIKNSSPRRWPKKQEPSTPRKAVINSVKTDAKREVKPSTPSIRKSVGNIPKNSEPPGTSIVAKKENNVDVIPVMNPALYNVNSFAARYQKRANLENAVPQDTVQEGKLESWIDGHEQAYLRGRAIGLKVASMARAAKADLKCEYMRSGLKSTTPITPSNKSQEIVDIGVSVIEKVLAEKDNKIHFPPVRGDQPINYNNFEKKSKWNSTQMFM